MSLKATVFFSVWVSFWCALFNFIYIQIPALQGHPWIMFICLAIFFGMGSTLKDVPHLMASAVCGPIWGQVDLFLMTLGVFGSVLGGFFPIFVGTAITMIIHIYIHSFRFAQAQNVMKMVSLSLFFLYNSSCRELGILQITGR